MSAESVLVTGGAGFIGSHLVERLVKQGYYVKVLDNFDSGTEKNLADVVTTSRVEVIRGDIVRQADVQRAMKGSNVIFHFAANPEVRLGDPKVHFEVNIGGTFNILEAMRVNHAKEIIFASSSTVYGDAESIPTPETYSPLQPISVYGAAKLACESLISAYSKSYGVNAIVLRFANIVGSRLRHGVIYDFVQKLRTNPRELEILGDGTQRKSYLLIDDAIDAIDCCRRSAKSDFSVYNVGSLGDTDVRTIADILVEVMGLKNVRYNFTGGVAGGRGWIGDVKFMRLDVTKLRSLGWSPKCDSAEAIKVAARSIVNE